METPPLSSLTGSEIVFLFGQLLAPDPDRDPLPHDWKIEDVEKELHRRIGMGELTQEGCEDTVLMRLLSAVVEHNKPFGKTRPTDKTSLKYNVQHSSRTIGTTLDFDLKALVWSRPLSSWENHEKPVTLNIKFDPIQEDTLDAAIEKMADWLTRAAYALRNRPADRPKITL